MDLKKHIRSIPDYPKKGILFRDITTLIKNADAFKYTNDKIIEIAKNIDFDKVAAIESRGFVFASTISYLLNKPFILLRKKNKLPADVHSIDFELEYGKATIEVHKDSIEKNEKILVIDDLIATGGTAEAAAKLIEISGGKVAGFIFVINLFDLPGNDLLKKKGYFTKSLIEFPWALNFFIFPCCWCEFIIYFNFNIVIKRSYSSFFNILMGFFYTFLKRHCCFIVKQ